MALFRQTGLICEDSIVHPQMNTVLNKKLETSGVDYPSNSWAKNVNIMAVMPTKTASGSVLTITDSADDVQLKEGKFNIDYNANGLSSMAITRCGKNFFNIEGETLGAYLLSDGTIRNDATAVSWNLSDYIPVKEGETYYFNPNTTAGSSAKHGYYDASKGFVSSINSGASSFTIPSGVSFMRFSYRNTSTDIQLELGSTDTAYEAYQGTTYLVSFGTTIYGGYFESETGVLTSTKASDGTDLATPVEYQLSKVDVILKAELNNLWCNTGDCEVEYSVVPTNEKGIKYKDLFTTPLGITGDIIAGYCMRGLFGALSDEHFVQFNTTGDTVIYYDAIRERIWRSDRWVCSNYLPTKDIEEIWYKEISKGTTPSMTRAIGTGNSYITQANLGNYIYLRTVDILDENGNVILKANCTLEDFGL